MSIEAVVKAVLESGQITREQEERINQLLHQEQCTDADLCALDTLCVALFMGQVRSVITPDELRPATGHRAQYAA